MSVKPKLIVSVEEKQIEALRKLKDASGVSISYMIREAIDLLLEAKKSKK